MRQKNVLITGLTLLLALNGCGDGGSDFTSPTTVPPASTYSVTLTAIELDRSADQQDMPVTGVPADGASLTIP